MQRDLDEKFRSRRQVKRMEIDEIESRIQELSSQSLTELETVELLELLKIAVEYHSNNDLIDMEAH
jgi:hypothetical protein